MARDSAVLDTDETAGNNDENAGLSGNDGLLHRRGYLKIASATAVAGAATLAGAASADEEYDVITVGAGQREVIRVDDGETLENLLIDCTANNAQVVIAAHGTNWTIRNVGIRGRVSNSDAIIGVSDRQGNTSRIENVYVGDGATDGHRVGLGIWVAPQHSGHIDIDRVNIQEMGDNSFYCSAPMHSGAGGTVDISNSYSKDSWVSHFRLGEGTVSNCTAVNTSTRDDGRGVWAWAPGDVIVEECNLVMNGRHYSIVAGANGRGSNVRVRNTEYDTGFNDGFRRPAGGQIDLESGNGTNPQDVVPDGCPTSAEEAATGGGASSDDAGSDSSDDAESDSSDDQSGHRLRIDGADEGVTRYEFEVDSEVVPTTDEGATIDEDLVIEDGHVQGSVANWRDAFRFEGDLEQLSLDGPATALLDGEEIDPDEYGEELPHVIEIEGEGEPASFELTVDGTIAYDGDDPEEDATIVSGTSVQSSVTDSNKRYRFSGVITDLTFSDGSAAVSLDGESVDVTDVGADDSELYPHAVVIDGSSVDDPTVYSFRATGGVVNAGYGNASLGETGEAVPAGRAVRGAVDNWLDAYWFDGSIQTLTLLGDADVDVIYNARDL